MPRRIVFPEVLMGVNFQGIVEWLLSDWLFGMRALLRSVTVFSAIAAILGNNARLALDPTNRNWALICFPIHSDLLRGSKSIDSEFDDVARRQVPWWL